jgi:hypothetical protein
MATVLTFTKTISSVVSQTVVSNETFAGLGASLEGLLVPTTIATIPLVDVESESERRLYIKNRTLTGFDIYGDPAYVAPPYVVKIYVTIYDGDISSQVTGVLPSLTLQQMEGRLRGMRWQIPGEKMPVNLWGGEGKKLMPVSLMRKLITQAIGEWAMETRITKDVWEIADSNGDVSTLTSGERRYSLPDDLMIITEAKVAYDDDDDVIGYPMVIVSGADWDGSLVNVKSASSDATVDAKTGRPERMFIWENEFELDPVPDDDYTFRMWGYKLPSGLSNATDEVDALHFYQESIYAKAKELIGRELSVVNEGQIVGQYERVKKIAKDFDRARHSSPGVVDVGEGSVYWRR